MKKPTIKILKGRQGLNDWLELSFAISNHIDLIISVWGFGFHFNWIIKNSVKEFVETLNEKTL